MNLKNWLGAAAMAAIMTGGVAAHAQTAGGTFVFIAQPEPPSLASYLSTSGPIGLVAPKIYEGLLDYDKDLNAIPSLAESFEVSEDGLTVTFNLQKGVTWHDGEPFTSADVQFTVMEVLSKVHPRGPNSFKEVTAIETPDEHTAVFKLANPAPYMTRALSGYESPMVPKHLLEGQDPRDADLANNPVGTGPFKAPVPSSSSSGRRVNISVSTRTRTTGVRACLILTRRSLASSRTRRPEQPRWKMARFTMVLTAPSRMSTWCAFVKWTKSA